MPTSRQEAAQAEETESGPANARTEPQSTHRVLVRRGCAAPPSALVLDLVRPFPQNPQIPRLIHLASPVERLSFSLRFTMIGVPPQVASAVGRLRDRRAD